jgi:DNA-binding SARP family transcriptional activator
LGIPVSHLDFVGHFAAAVIYHQAGEQTSFALLRQLRKLHTDAPLLFLSREANKEESCEAFRSGATDCIEEFVDLEGLFCEIERLLPKKVTTKAQQIAAALREIGNKISTAFYHAQPYHLVHPLFQPPTVEAESAKPVIRVQFFGAFAFTIKGREQAIPLSRRQKALLAYLLLNHHQWIPREQLLDRFWTDTTADCGQNSLQVAICGIRRWLKSVDAAHDYIEFKTNRYCFNPPVEVESDVAFFLQYFRQAWQLHKADQLEAALHAYHRAFAFYRDTFLVEFDQEEWIAHERRHLEEKFIVVLENLGASFLAYRQFDFAIDLYEKILETDNCYEPAHRGLLQCYYAKNRTKQALQQYKTCVAALQKELDAKPSAETTRLYEFIRTQPTAGAACSAVGSL